MERAAEAMLARHRAEDARDVEPTLAVKDVVRRERLVRDAAELRTWLARNPDDRRGETGAARQRNRTDNESARMATSKSVAQGYTGGPPSTPPSRPSSTPLGVVGTERRLDLHVTAEDQPPLHSTAAEEAMTVEGRVACRPRNRYHSRFSRERNMNLGAGARMAQVRLACAR